MVGYASTLYGLILQDMLKVPTTMLCHMVDMPSVEQLVMWVMAVQSLIKADTQTEETRHGSHSSREEGVEGGGDSLPHPLPATPMQQFRGIKEEGLVPRLGGVEST